MKSNNYTSISLLFLFVTLFNFSKANVLNNENFVNNKTIYPKNKVINNQIYQDPSIAPLAIERIEKSNSFQLFSHGRPGQLLLNGKWCNAQEIATFLQPKLRNSQIAISNLNIYGCEFAKGSIGLQAVAYLQKTLGISVSASTNITGKDGDWVLEVGKAKDVIAINDYNGNLQCTYGNSFDLQYPISNTGTLPNYNTVANGVTGPPDQLGNIAALNNNASDEIVATFATALTAGQTIYVTGKWATWANYTSLNGQGVNTGDKIFIEYSANGTTFTSTAAYTPNFNNNTFTTAAFTIPATAPVGTKYVRIRGASATTYDYIDAIGVTMPRCANPPVSGVAYVDNGTGGGTASNCVKDGTESASSLPTGTYIKIRKTTDIAAISATSLPTSGAFTIPDVANGTYIVYLDDNNSLRDTTATNPINFRGTITKIVTITNGVATPALNFCLKFLDTDGDGIGNDVDIDDDNDGVLDVVENACNTATALVPTSATSSSNWGGSGADKTIAGLQFSGTGLTAVKDSAWDISNGFLLGNPLAATNWIDYNFGAGTSLNAVALWANTAEQHNYGDAPLKDFQVEVTSGSGVWTSGVFSTANPGLSAKGKAQIFDLGQNFTNVTKVRIKIVSGWVDVNGDQTLFVPTYTTQADGSYNMELGEFRGVGGSCNGIVDTDGDGIPNSLDLDSDGDGCPDAVESGTSLLSSTLPAPAGMGATTGLANAVVTGTYGTNGFSNNLEAVADNGIYKGTYTYNPNAISTSINACADSDGDGIPDSIDLDDDNDGILDVVENNCAVGVVPVSKVGALAGLAPGGTQYTYGAYTGAGIPAFLDGALAGSQGLNSPSKNLNNAPWFMVEFPTPHQLTSWEVHNTGTYGLFDNTSTYKVQASNDATTWTDVSGTLTYSASQTGQAGNAFSNIAPINATVPYKYYRYYGLSATDGGGWSYEFYFTENATCPDIDTDGDGIPNRLDLDSDGDGCPDAKEGGSALAATNPSGMPGGNSGTGYTGTTSTPVTVNITTTAVGHTPTTMGVPTAAIPPAIATIGQTIGYSEDKTVNACLDTDGDGVPDIIDLDDDNDGILDVNEMQKACDLPVNWTVKAYGGYNGFSSGSLTDYSQPYVNTIGAPIGTGTYSGNSISAGSSHSSTTLNSYLTETGVTYTGAGDADRWAVEFDYIVPATGTYTIDAPSNVADAFEIRQNSTTIYGDCLVGCSGSGSVTQTFNKGDTIKILNAEGSTCCTWFNASLTVPCNAYVDIDTDGDGIPNRLDLDSDGDGCPDAVEASVKLASGATFTNAPAGMGATTGTVNSVAPSPYGANGFSDAMETATESGIYKYNYTYRFAIDPTKNACSDADGDGVADVFDLDDDNDGILNAVESPTCFYTAAKASVFKATSSDLTWNSTYPLSNATNGNSAATDFTQLNPYNQTIDGKSIITLSDSLNLYVPITSVNVQMGVFGYAAGATAKLQGWDGMTWVDLSASTNLNVTSATQTFTNTLQPNGYFSKVRIEGISGTTNYDRMVEITVTLNNFQPSLNPTPTCTGSDLDGDGIPNYLDLDSDGDGCPDAIEGGSPFTNANLSPSTMAGGNSGGTFSGVSPNPGPVIQNLGNTVGNTATTMGVPTIATTGQTVGTSENKLTKDPSCCAAGYNAPNIAPTTISNTCPATSVNLSALTSSVTAPVGSTKIWSLHNPPTSANDTLTAAAATTITTPGKYYSAFRNTASGCFSPLVDSITVYIVSCVPPTILPDVNAGIIGQPIPGNVSTNDIVPTGTTYGTPVPVGTNPSTAVPTMNANGSYTFTATVPGVYTFDVPVCPPGQSTGCPTTRLVITVANPASTTNVPVANTDYATIAPGGTSVTVPITANDAPVNPGNTLAPPTLVGTNGGAKHGTASINASGGLVYTPTPGFTGVDTVYYQVCETPSGKCATAMSIISVLPPATPNTTTATDDYASTSGTTPATGNVLTNDVDAEGNTQTVTAQGSAASPIVIPGQGSYYINSDGTYSFTALPGFTGTVNIPYSVCDNGTPLTCATASLHVVVKPAVVLNPDVNSGIIGKPIPGNVASNDVVPPGTTYGTPAVNPSNPSSAVPTMNADGTYTFSTTVPGTYTFNVPVCPAGQTTGCPTVPLVITVANPAGTTNVPTAGPDLASTSANTPVTVPILANDVPANPGNTLGTPTLVGANGGAAHGTATINASGQLVYTPAAGFVGTDTVRYQVCETPSGICTTAISIITVLPSTSNATVASDDVATTTGTTPATGNVLSNDNNSNGNTLTVTPQGSAASPIVIPGQGSYYINSDGTYSFTPLPGFTGTVNIPYTVCDGSTPPACATASLHVVVKPVVVLHPDINAGIIGTTIPGNVSTNDNVPAGTTYGTPVAAPGNPSATVPVMNADGSYTFTPTAPGVYTFNVPVCPAGQTTGCPTEPLVITVTDPTLTNNVPVINNDQATTLAGTPVNIPVLANDQIGNTGGTLGTPTLPSTTSTNGGTLSVNADGSIKYTPPTGFVGIDSFTYQVCETPSGVCKIATVVVTVLPTNSPNSTSASDDYAATVGSNPVTGNVLTNDVDPQGATQTQTVTSQGSSAAQQSIAGVGTYYINANGTFGFTPAPGFVGTAAIPYTVCDNGSPQACATATLYVVVGSLTVTPIGLTNFTATKINNGAGLIWNTSTEINAANFEIEYSTNGSNNWQTLAKVKASGVSGSAYNYVHNYNKSGILYYRLKLVDKDGIYKYSELRKVNFNEQTNLTIAPNPVNNDMYIYSNKLLKSVELFNSVGSRVLILSNYNAGKVIDVSNMAKGIYFVKIEDNNGNVEVKKVIKN